MFNVKTAAAAIAAVAVTGACVKEYITRTRKCEDTTPEAVKAFYSPEFLAFTKAQDVLSERMMSGVFDNHTDDEVRAVYNVLYNTFLTK